MTQKQQKIWRDGDYYCNDDEFFEWYEGHQKRIAQKAKVEEELLSIAWHPDHVMNWCMSEGEKGWWK